MHTHTHTHIQGSVNFKFGVLYSKAGQKTDNDMFSNGEHLDVVKITSLTSTIVVYVNVICKNVDTLPVVMYFPSH